MIYLLYGSNIAASRQMLERFILRFKREAGPSWEMIDGADDGAASHIAQIGSGSLFAKKDFYIIKRASALDIDMRDALKSHLERWAKDDSVIVFWEEGIPVKNKIFTDIEKCANKKEEFSDFTRQKFSAFVDARAKDAGASVGTDAKESLWLAYNKQPQHFARELERVLLGGEIERAHGTDAPSDKDIFMLGDLWGSGERVRAALLFERFVRAGYDASDVLRPFLWHIKNLARVASGKMGDMKPFVVQKARTQMRNFSRGQIEAAYLQLLEMSDMTKKETLETRFLQFLLTPIR
jgi:DNA polymerase III delta subunit